MNFELVGTGHSFKGAMAYYLHDKRQGADGPHPETSERVAWTEFRNLAVLTPETATRVMIATAMQADELKAAAGIKNTGRKATGGAVYAFSLQWEPGELPSRDPAEMRACADRALKILGLDHLQSVIVAHQDTAHPHVHVIVNRVDPTNGKTATIAPGKVRTLDRWAYEYERDRGQIVSPDRARKYEAIERGQEQHPDPDERKAYIEEQKRKAAEAKRQREADAKQGRTAPQIDAQRDKPKSEAALLKDLSDAQKARHKAEWAAFGQVMAKTRKATWASYGDQVKAAIATHKAETKAIWAQHFAEVRADRRAFDRREKELGGIIRNALEAAKHQQRSGQAGERGTLSLAFSNTLSSNARRAAFEDRADLGRLKLARELRGVLDREIGAIKEQRTAALDRVSTEGLKARSALIETQNAERAKMREAWKQVYERRGQNPEPKARKAALENRQPMPATSPAPAARPDRAGVLLGAKNNRRQFRRDEIERSRKAAPPIQQQKPKPPAPVVPPVPVTPPPAPRPDRSGTVRPAPAYTLPTYSKPTPKPAAQAKAPLAAARQQQPPKPQPAATPDMDARLAAMLARFDQSMARPPATPSPEQEPVKEDFDKARRLPTPPQPKNPDEQRLAVPMPQPTPTGVPAPPPTKLHNVPHVDKAAEWAKTEQARQIVQKDAPPPSASRALQKATQPPPAPARPAPPAHARQTWNPSSAPPAQATPQPLPPPQVPAASQALAKATQPPKPSELPKPARPQGLPAPMRSDTESEARPARPQGLPEPMQSSPASPTPPAKPQGLPDPFKPTDPPNNEPPRPTRDFYRSR